MIQQQRVLRTECPELLVVYLSVNTESERET